MKKDAHKGIRLEAPDGVKATRGGYENAVKVTWNLGTDVGGYIVFKSKDYSGPYLPIRKIIRDPSFVDTNVKVGTYYWYKVRSIRRFKISKPSKRAQGWAHPFMPGGSETPKDLIARLVRSLPHFYRVRYHAKKREKELPSPRDVTHLVPSNEEIFEYVRNICATPHRRIGSPESLRAEEYIMREFQTILGEENVYKEPVPCDVYNATHWKLEVEHGGRTQEMDAFYTVNTGITYGQNPNGGTVTGTMVWAGEGKPEDIEKLGDDLSGKIVVAQCPFPVFPLGILMKAFNNFYYTSDPTQSLNIRSKRSFTFARKNFPAEYTEKRHEGSVYWRAHSRGAEGLILILKNHPGKVNTHWGPYAGKMKPMPCMYVDNYMNDEMKALAEKGARASITIEGALSPGAGHNIYGVLPGRSEDAILVSSHHDAPFKGATEDGTGVATVLALAKTWARVPFEERDKTIIFVSTTGHFYGGKGAREFSNGHRDDILRNVMICINVEHIAAKDFVDDGAGAMVSTGEQAVSFVFVNEDFTAIAAARRMLQRHGFERAVLLQSNLLGPVPPGEAGHYHMYTGVSFIHWIGQPYYVLTADDTFDKVDMAKLNPTAKGIADLIGTYMDLEV